MLNAFGCVAVATEDVEIIKKSNALTDGGITNSYLIKDGKCEIGTEVNNFKERKNQSIFLYQMECNEDFDKIFKAWGILIKNISKSEETRDYYFIVDKQLDFSDKYFRAEIIKTLTEQFSDKDFVVKNKEHILGRHKDIGLDTLYFLTHSNILGKLFEAVRSAGWDIGTIEVQDDDLYDYLKNDEAKGIKLPRGKSKILIPSFTRIVFQGIVVPSNRPSHHS